MKNLKVFGWVMRSPWPLSLTQPASYAFAVPLDNQTNSTRTKCWCLPGQVSQSRTITAIQAGNRKIGAVLLKVSATWGNMSGERQSVWEEAAADASGWRSVKIAYLLRHPGKSSIGPTWWRRNTDRTQKRRRSVRSCGTATTLSKFSNKSARRVLLLYFRSCTKRTMTSYTRVCAHGEKAKIIVITIIQDYFL